MGVCSSSKSESRHELIRKCLYGMQHISLIIKYDFFIEGREKDILKEHFDFIDSFEEKGNTYIITAVNCNCLNIWNLNKRKSVMTFPVGSYPSRKDCTILLKDQIITGNVNGEIKMWNIKTGKCDSIISCEQSISCVVKLSDGKFATGFYSGLIKIWEGSNCIRNLYKDDQTINYIAHLWDDRILSISGNKRMRIWNKDQSVIFIYFGDEIRHYVLLPNKRKIIIGQYDTWLGIFDLVTGKCEEILNIYTNSIKEIIPISDQRIIINKNSRSVAIMNLKTFHYEFKISGYLRYLKCIALLPNEELAIASEYSIDIWNHKKCNTTIKINEDLGQIIALYSVSSYLIAITSGYSDIVIIE